MMGPVEQIFKEWAGSYRSVITESLSYPYQGDRSKCYRLVRAESYERLDQKKPCRLKQRVETVRSINKFFIIESGKALKSLYETVIREMKIAYQIEPQTSRYIFLKIFKMSGKNVIICY